FALVERIPRSALGAEGPTAPAAANDRFPRLSGRSLLLSSLSGHAPRQTLSVRRSNGCSCATAALHKVLQVSWRGDRQRPLFSNGKLPGQSFRYCHVLQLHIVGQAILEWWIGFTNDQRRQIPAGRLGDAEAVDAD